MCIDLDISTQMNTVINRQDIEHLGIRTDTKLTFDTRNTGLLTSTISIIISNYACSSLLFSTNIELNVSILHSCICECLLGVVMCCMCAFSSCVSRPVLFLLQLWRKQLPRRNK